MSTEKVSKKDNKLVMLYHRSYRKLPGSISRVLLEFFLIAMPFSVITAIFYPQITEQICIITKSVLEPYYYTDSISIFSREYIKQIGPLFYINLPESFPGFLFSLINAIIAILFLIILPGIKKFKPLLIFIIIISIVHLCSSLYFLLFPAFFPYSASDYSQLYMLQEISIWFFMPLILGLAVLPLPSNPLLKLLTIGSIYAYSLIFGTVRYILFLLIISKMSMIYMAVLFFALGPLIDFIYAVGFYTLFVNNLAKKLAEDFSIWRWQ